LKLQAYIFGILLKNFLVLVVAVTGVVFLVGMVSSLDRHQDLPLSQILARLPYLVPFALSLAIPLSLLIASLMTYGRLSADNEIVAIRMGGIHPLRTLVPGLTLGMCLVVLTLWMNSSVAPVSSQKAREIRKDDVRKFFDSLETSGRTDFHSENMDLRWQAVDEQGWIIEPHFEIRARDDERIDGRADRGLIRRDEDLENIYITFLGMHATVGEAGSELRSRRWEQVFPISDLFDTRIDRERKEVLTSGELRFRFSRDPQLAGKLGGLKMIRFRFEYLRRIALAFSCFVFVLIGAPLGMLFRRGSFIGATIIALLIVFLIYYPVLEAGKNMAGERTISPELATALPGLVVGLIGIGLTIKVVRT
jgi:lipopolysaccharide export LptBFGC system permease protein LptF